MARLKRIMVTNLVVTLLVLFAIGALAPSDALAQTNWTDMPFKYRNSATGKTYPGVARFYDTYYVPDDYCVQDHRDPDDQQYVHSHLPHGFPFDVWNGETQQTDQVTVTKSDWAWDFEYLGYDKFSSSTFDRNCFPHAVSAPTVMFVEGWDAFTDSCYFCDATSMAKAEHALRITVSSAPGCIPDHWVSETDEKMASSGTYRYDDWTYPGRDSNGFDCGTRK